MALERTRSAPSGERAHAAARAMPRKARNKEFALVTVAAVGTARVQLVGMALSIAEKQGANACVCSTLCALAAPDLITVMLCVAHFRPRARRFCSPQVRRA